MRQERRMKERQKKAKADPDKLWALRIKFLEQCKKYFGRPYAKKYWSPDGETRLGWLCVCVRF